MEDVALDNLRFLSWIQHLFSLINSPGYLFSVEVVIMKGMILLLSHNPSQSENILASNHNF